jgi:VIT1/CCC1 family predicted Fe2+/Mn2+ transporter
VTVSISKRIEEARKAYQKGDKEAAAAAHTSASIYAEEQHGGASSRYLGDMVFGGLDGIITTFAVVSGVAGAQLGARVVLIMGLANLFADGFSMAIGAYLSSKSDQEYYQREREREAWEVQNFPEGERAELFEIYHSKGYSEEDTKNLVEIKTRNPELWLDTMMIEELGMLKDESKPIINALTTLIAFILAGSIPMFIYIIGLFFPISATVTFPISLGFSALGLFGLGAAKVFVTHRNALKSGWEMLLVGGLAAGVAYLVGTLLKGIGS